MKRLYSFWGLYSFVIGAPMFSLAILTMSFIISNSVSNSAPIMAFIIIVPLMGYWLLTFRRWKKVYYEGETLYIFNVFSNSPIVVNKENIGGINRVMFYDPRFYKLVYYDQNKDAKTVYFQKNWFLKDFGDIIDKLNY